MWQACRRVAWKAALWLCPSAPLPSSPQVMNPWGLATKGVLIAAPVAHPRGAEGCHNCGLIHGLSPQSCGWLLTGPDEWRRQVWARGRRYSWRPRLQWTLSTKEGRAKVSGPLGKKVHWLLNCKLMPNFVNPDAKCYFRWYQEASRTIDTLFSLTQWDHQKSDENEGLNVTIILSNFINKIYVIGLANRSNMFGIMLRRPTQLK